MLSLVLKEFQSALADPQVFRLALEVVLCVLSGYIAVKIKGICRQFNQLLKQQHKAEETISRLPCISKENGLWLKDVDRNGGEPPEKIVCPISDFTTKH